MSIDFPVKRLVLWITVTGALICGTVAIVISWDDLYALIYPESRLWGDWTVTTADVPEGEGCFLAGLPLDPSKYRATFDPTGYFLLLRPSDYSPWWSFDMSGIYEVRGRNLVFSELDPGEPRALTIQFENDSAELWLSSGERVEVKLRRVSTDPDPITERLFSEPGGDRPTR